LSILSSLSAQVVERPDPLDKSRIDIMGSIADTNVQRLLGARETLSPKFGIEDVFLVRGGKQELDLAFLGSARPFFAYTAMGIVTGGSTDRFDRDKKITIEVGQVEGSTQLLVYEAIPGSTPDVPPTRSPEPLKVYRITVTTQDVITRVQELKTLVGDVEGLQIRVIAGRVVLDGNILLPREMRRVLAVVRDLNANIQDPKARVASYVEMSPTYVNLVAQKMEEEIAGGKDRPKDIRVRVVNSRFFLEGTVDKLADRQAAELICNSYLPEKYLLEFPSTGAGGQIAAPQVTNVPECVVTVRIRAGQPKEPDPIIHVRFDFVTINRNYLRSFGFNWSPGLSFPSGGEEGGSQPRNSIAYSSDTGKFLTQITGIVSNLFPKLQTAANHGHARVLKTVHLLTADMFSQGSGGPPTSSFSENLSIPTVTTVNTANGPVQTPGTIDVNTEVTVRAASVPGSDKINLSITAGTAEPKGSGNGAVPVLRNNINTQVVVPDSKSAAIGGIISERRQIGITRDPADTSDFTLFEVGRSYSFVDDKGQFIMFVTPTKMRTTEEGTETLKRKFRLRK
jgi:pilus assembly protein CpaC